MSVDVEEVNKRLRRHVGPTFYCKTMRFKGYDVGQVWEKFPLGDRKVIDILDPFEKPCDFKDYHMEKVFEYRTKMRGGTMGKRFDSGDDYSTHEKWIKNIKGRKASST